MKRLTRAASVQAGAKSRFLSVLIGALALLPGLAVLAQVPSIIVPPASQTSAVGGTIQFTVSATGGGTLVYQWRKNTTNLSNGTFSGRATVSGATATAMTLAGVTTNDQANYACFISNTSGSITSSVASLAIILAPTITTQPISISTNIGAAVSFSVVASGTAPFTYQWYKDSSPISGATLNAYSLSGLLASDSGTYNVRASNPAGSATSTDAILNVGTAPAITAQPASLTVTQGQSATFSVTATGTSLSYYWKKNGTFIPGQTNAALTFASVADTDASSYTCQVSNFLNTVTSAGAVLTVYYPPYITAQPTNQTIGVGSSLNLKLTGFPNYSYVLQTTTNLTPPIQWQSVLTTTADSNGVSQFADTNTSDPQKFYRSLMLAPSGMVLIPAGSFTMGNSIGDADIHDAVPVTANVSAFYMDANLVTWSQWQGVYVYATNHGYGFVNGGSGKAANHPVQSVSRLRVNLLIHAYPVYTQNPCLGWSSCPAEHRL